MVEVVSSIFSLNNALKYYEDDSCSTSSSNETDFTDISDITFIEDKEERPPLNVGRKYVSRKGKNPSTRRYISVELYSPVTKELIFSKVYRKMKDIQAEVGEILLTNPDFKKHTICPNVWTHILRYGLGIPTLRKFGGFEFIKMKTNKIYVRPHHKKNSATNSSDENSN